jgi:hypothetical protein
MTIWVIIFFTIKAFLWFLGLALFFGTIRLFILGIRKRYEGSISDISVLKKGDIVLTGKQSVFYSPAIQISNVLTRKVKHRFWTHVAIYRGEGKLWEAQTQGIIERDINDYIKNGFILRAFRHRYIADETKLDSIIKFCEERKGYKYGKVGLIFYIFSTFIPFSFNFLFDNRFIDKICHLDNAYFCSELIVDAFKASDYPVSPYDGWRVKPTDFISNPFFMQVKES